MKSYEELIGMRRSSILKLEASPQILALLDAEGRRLAASQHTGRRKVPRAEVIRVILEGYLLPRAKELKGV